MSRVLAAPGVQESPRALPAFERFTLVASVIVMLGSLSVILGWAGDYELFKKLTPGGETTKPLGAIGLFCSGAALFLSRRKEGATESWRRHLGVACAGVPLLIGGLTLLEQGLDFDLGIHRVLFAQTLMAEGPFAGRPVFPISLCLVLLGLALVTMHSRAIRLGALVLVALFLGLLVLIGYLYHAVPFYRVEAQRPVPVIAALLVVTTALAYLSARPESAMLDVVTSHPAGGATARRLLPAAILLPLGLGLLRLIGQRIGLYGMEFGLALFATLNMTVFVALVYSSARRLNQADAKRGAAHAALLDSEESFRRLLNATPSGLILVDPDGRIALANATAERLFGYGPGRMPGERLEALVPERFRARHATLRHGFSSEERPRSLGAGRDVFGLRQDGAEFPVEIGLSSVEMSRGRFTLASVVDITERKRADAVRDITERERAGGALRRSEQRLNRAQEIAHLGSWELDLENDTLTWSDEVYRIFGLQPQEFGATYAAFLEAVHPEDRAAVDAAYSSSIREGRDTYEIEHRIVRRPDGEVRFVHEKCEHFRDEAGRIVRSVGMVHDITERERTQAEIRELARQHRLALDAAGMGWWHYDPVTQVATWDDRCREIFGATGYTRPNEQILARLHPDDLLGVRAKVEAALDPSNPRPYSEAAMDPSSPRPYSAEYRINLPDGTMKWIDARGVASFEGTGGDRRATSLVGTVADITERKRAQAQLSAALQHKEALLKEIHHRVKNNLQVISSLLRLQSAAVDDPRMRELVADSQRRVRAMALIHEQLYQSSDLARIDFESYVLNLVNYLRRSLTPAGSSVEIRVSIENVLLGMDQAMPLGLLVSELVSNSLKHAFPCGGGAPAGEVSIVARRDPSGGLTLVVGDNGVGLPDEVDIEHSPSMGLQLVRSFVDQLQGELSVQRRPGTVLTVTIPEKRD